jgi:pilus assembly protein Flp/PilA
MLNYIRTVTQRRRDDDGASAVEYGLLVAAIAAVILLVVFALGKVVKGSFQDTCNSIKNSTNSPNVTNQNCN